MDEGSEKSEFFDKELEDIKRSQIETKNTIMEMKNTLEGIYSRLDDTEKQVSELENSSGNH